VQRRLLDAAAAGTEHRRLATKSRRRRRHGALAAAEAEPHRSLRRGPWLAAAGSNQSQVGGGAGDLKALNAAGSLICNPRGENDVTD
jgi:hypothetical protein